MNWYIYIYIYIYIYMILTTQGLPEVALQSWLSWMKFEPLTTCLFRRSNRLSYHGMSWTRIQIQLWAAFHCVKSVCIRTYSGPYFAAFGLNTEKYEVYLLIQSKCCKIRTRITLNTDTLNVVFVQCWNIISPISFANCHICFNQHFAQVITLA